MNTWTFEHKDSTYLWGCPKQLRPSAQSAALGAEDAHQDADSAVSPAVNFLLKVQ